MSLIVLLDSGPLGLATNPKESAEALACQEWLRNLLLAGHRALVPAITDYEVRRELRLYGKVIGERNLDRLKASFGFLPLTTEALLQAADFWASARRVGLPTADKFALDADVILAAQAATLEPEGWARPDAKVVIATTNVGHLSQFTEAYVWQDIR